ncbi:uncharacterized protein LOC142972632 [Anticarsia gemmatalis]|uniref:uncharacterized protein LOC142972632 n=1 Tax=Anticarsia gemmatalis TaxID=129554 RepID=UPI003F76C209
MKEQKLDSDSEASGSESSGTERGGGRYRVSVRLERFFSDERARAFVCVRPGRRVRWLARRLRALFPALPPRLALLNRGHLLPPAEPLAVLRRDDTVHVVPARADAEDPPPPSAPGATDPDLDDSRAVSSAPETVAAARHPSTFDDSERDRLMERKRHALLALERLYGDGEGDSGAPKPRRRRVRRRRRPAPPSDLADLNDLADPADLADVDRVAAGSEERASSVLQNGCRQSRLPRLIRPLGEGDEMSS